MPIDFKLEGARLFQSSAEMQRPHAVLFHHLKLILIVAFNYPIVKVALKIFF